MTTLQFIIFLFGIAMTATCIAAAFHISENNRERGLKQYFENREKFAKLLIVAKTLE